MKLGLGVWTEAFGRSESSGTDWVGANVVIDASIYAWTYKKDNIPTATIFNVHNRFFCQQQRFCFSRGVQSRLSLFQHMFELEMVEAYESDV